MNEQKTNNKTKSRTAWHNLINNNHYLIKATDIALSEIIISLNLLWRSQTTVIISLQKSIVYQTQAHVTISKSNIII